MTKAYNKNDVKAMKETYIKAPYKGKPYMDYLRDKNRDKYLNYLKKQIKYLNTNEPTGNNLGTYYTNLFNTMFNNYEEFFNDPVADGSVLDDEYYFWLPTRLMTGEDVYKQTKNVLDGLDKFKEHIIKVHKWQLVDRNREKWIQNQKKNYFSFDTDKLIKMSKKASNLYSLYTVKLNQDGTFINIREATYKDVLCRLQKLVKKYTNKKYRQLVNKVNKVDNELVKIHTDCMIATHAHFDMDKQHEKCNACDKDSFKNFKYDKSVLNHLPTCKESQIFKNNILKIFKITNQIIKNNKCTKAMSNKQSELCLPLYSIQNILEQMNLETIM